MSSDMPEVASNEKMSPTCRICVSKEEAAKMKVGSDVTVDVSGQVKSLHPSYDDKSMYEVEIENPKCEVEASDEKESDDKYNMATMPRKKLKEKIMKKEEDEE